MFEKRSKALFVSGLLASAYLIYLIVYFIGASNSADSTEAIGGMIATALVTPHMALIALGVIFSWVGFFSRKPWAALTGAILFSVAAVVFLPYAVFVVPMIILGFVGYSNQNKLIKNAV